MQIIRKIGLILLISLLIASTGGYSIYSHFCHCAGERSASVFFEASCDHDTSIVPGSCCAVEDTPSCCAEKPAVVKKPACHDDDCCKTSILYLKIIDSFQPGLEKINLKPLFIPLTIIFIDLTEDLLSSSIQTFITADLPPPKRGKQILLAFHQLKLDPSLS